MARQDDLLFLILPGEELSLVHFVRDDTVGDKKTGQYITPLDKIQNLLIREFGQRRWETSHNYHVYSACLAIDRCSCSIIRSALEFGCGKMKNNEWLWCKRIGWSWRE